LSRVIVHEPIVGGSDLKVRVAGTAIRRRFGRDVTGETMSNLFPADSFPARFKSVLTAIETGAPQFAECQLSTSSFEILRSELVILPVLAPDRVSKWAMTFALFFN
ncbi:MAG TPA: PAS domain-containing protein, partial [Rhizomicrobium sp.]